MTISRALRALLPLALAVIGGLVAAVPAGAQDPAVALRLRAQTPFTTLEDPVVTITFFAENLGEEAIGDLSVGHIVGPAIDSRFEYGSSLVEGPGPLPIGSNTLPQRGELAGGQTREFSVEIDLGQIGDVSALDSAVYPARIDLRSGGVSLAVLDTPLVHLVREPEVPVELSWWAEIDAPIALDPLGRLADPSFEATIAPGGALHRQVQALRTAVGTDDGEVAIDVVVVPAVVDQLVRMADGYERVSGERIDPDQPPATVARALLADLRELVADRDVRLVATPFAAPLLPSLASGGLARDLDRQRVAGVAVLAEHLGEEPATSVARPPQGALDEPSLHWLAEQGVTTVLAQADSVERPPQPNEFAPLPTASVGVAGGIDLVLPDPGVQALLSDPLVLADPVRAGQAVLGELATIWREQPVPGLQLDGTQTVRGVAVGLPAGLPGEAWAPIVRRLSEAPFLHPQHAASFAQQVHPVTEAPEVVPSVARFPRTYVEAIRNERRDIAAYRSMLSGPSPHPARLERNLLYAEAGIYVADPTAGRRWYDQVNAATDEIFRRVLPDVEQEFLLTSGEGSIPLRMGDPGEAPLTVQVVVRSAAFEFPGGARRTVTLEGPDEIVTIDVVAKVGGLQTIRLKTRAPSGRDLGEDQNLAVRTTAVNGFALWITIGAGVLLLVLWSRRLIRRPRR
jgi:hypothetical protein